MLHDYHLAEVIPDRVLERGRIVPLAGPSMCTRHLQGINYDRRLLAPASCRVC